MKPSGPPPPRKRAGRVPLAPCPRTPGLSRICLRASGTRNPRANHPHPNGLQAGGLSLGGRALSGRALAGPTLARSLARTCCKRRLVHQSSCLNTTPTEIRHDGSYRWPSRHLVSRSMLGRVHVLTLRSLLSTARILCYECTLRLSMFLRLANYLRLLRSASPL